MLLVLGIAFSSLWGIPLRVNAALRRSSRACAWHAALYISMRNAFSVILRSSCRGSISQQSTSMSKAGARKGCIPRCSAYNNMSFMLGVSMYPGHGSLHCNIVSARHCVKHVACFGSACRHSVSFFALANLANHHLSSKGWADWVLSTSLCPLLHVYV